MRKIKEIIIHCSATREGRNYTVADIDRWHRERGFFCIGYHFVIYRDGSIHVGRSVEEVGAHCKGAQHREHRSMLHRRVFQEWQAEGHQNLRAEGGAESADRTAEGGISRGDSSWSQ